MSFNHMQRRRQILDILFLYGAIMVINRMQVAITITYAKLETLLMVRCTRYNININFSCSIITIMSFFSNNFEQNVMFL